MSGLKVNFAKSRLFGINVEGPLLVEAAGFLNCKIGNYHLSTSVYLLVRILGRK
jgi:hypothetical protein